MAASASHLSTGEIEAKLAELDFPVPTTLLISSIRSRFIATLKLLEQAGATEPHRVKRHKLKLGKRHWASGSGSRDD